MKVPGEQMPQQVVGVRDILPNMSGIVAIESSHSLVLFNKFQWQEEKKQMKITNMSITETESEKEKKKLSET